MFGEGSREQKLSCWWWLDLCPTQLVALPLFFLSTGPNTDFSQSIQFPLLGRCTDMNTHLSLFPFLTLSFSQCPLSYSLFPFLVAMDREGKLKKENLQLVIFIRMPLVSCSLASDMQRLRQWCEMIYKTQKAGSTNRMGLMHAEI